jgi:hypothetical protein
MRSTSKSTPWSPLEPELFECGAFFRAVLVRADRPRCHGVDFGRFLLAMGESCLHPWGCLVRAGAREGEGIAMRSAFRGVVVLAGIIVAIGALVGCTSTAVTNPWELGGPADDGGTATGDGAATGVADARAGSSSDSAPPTHEASAPEAGAPEAGAPETSSPEDASAPAEAGADAGQVTSSDGFSASRTACINKINALRATDTAVALKPYTLENTDSINSCVDTQASTDQSKNSAHWSFINNSPSCTWGNATGFAQDECETGYGTTPAGIEQCLQDMWDESLKANCQGCVGCTAFGGACPNCDYSGSKGYECGHYVNMSAPYFTTVACGFAGAAPSSNNGWAVQNFE